MTIWTSKGVNELDKMVSPKLSKNTAGITEDQKVTKVETDHLLCEIARLPLLKPNYQKGVMKLVSLEQWNLPKAGNRFVWIKPLRVRLVHRHDWMCESVIYQSRKGLSQCNFKRWATSFCPIIPWHAYQMHP